MFKVLTPILAGGGARTLVMNIVNINPDLWGDGTRALVMNAENISPNPRGNVARD